MTGKKNGIPELLIQRRAFRDDKFSSRFEFPSRNLGGVRKSGWGRGFSGRVFLGEEPHYDQELEAHG